MDIRTLTSKKVMEMLNISRPTFDQWMKERKLKGYKVGHKWLFKEDEIMAFIEKGANMPEKESDLSAVLTAQAGDMKLAKRKAVVEKILSKNVKLEGMTTADLIRVSREEQEDIFG
jgi:excisionase family DNA binding protein